MEKPRLSFWQIWNMSFGFLGIQFGFALQNANTSRIFEILGADPEEIPILWIAAPVTGLLVQPIIGHYSDKTWGKLGRRRPYFLIGAILASIALVIMPNSGWLWMAAGMLWIMDASINISMEPFRAFVGDMLPNEQRTEGFAMQSFFIGIGAVLASVLPWVFTNWFGFTDSSDTGISDSVLWSFYLGAIVFFLAVLWTVMSTKEYPPERLEAFEKAEAERQQASGDSTVKYDPTPIESGVFYKSSLWWILAGSVLTAAVFFFGGQKELYILSIGIASFGLLQVIAGFMSAGSSSETPSGFLEVMGDLFKMPLTMKQLAVVQFFSWFALFSMWIYTTNAITAHHYDMHLSAAYVQQL